MPLFYGDDRDKKIAGYEGIRILHEGGDSETGEHQYKFQVEHEENQNYDENPFANGDNIVNSDNDSDNESNDDEGKSEKFWDAEGDVEDVPIGFGPLEMPYNVVKELLMKMLVKQPQGRAGPRVGNDINDTCRSSEEFYWNWILDF
jgi:hypothetical protein